jgi:hypothetical protein
MRDRWNGGEGNGNHIKTVWYCQYRYYAGGRIDPVIK